MSQPKVTRVKSGKRNAGNRVLQGRRILKVPASQTQSSSATPTPGIESGSGSTTGTATDSDLVSLERLEPVPLNIVNAVNSP